jgi:hypothetical protein
VRRSAPRAALLLLTIVSAVAAGPASGAEATQTAALVAEVRHSFTLGGKPIPPEIFRDFGDGDLADSGAIWVTVDAKAATGSNLYYDDITRNGAWVAQKKPGSGPGGDEQTAYSYIGAAENGLLVVLAGYSGGGSGDFITLHILDVTAARGFDLEGKIYDRVDLTNLRSIFLGDRWDGTVSVTKNAITVVTTRTGPADDSGKRTTTTIEAVRP